MIPQVHLKAIQLFRDHLNYFGGWSHGTRAYFFSKQFADGLSLKWDRPNSQVMFWARCRISLAILRAANICTRALEAHGLNWSRWLGLEGGSTIGMPVGYLEQHWDMRKFIETMQNWDLILSLNIFQNIRIFWT